MDRARSGANADQRVGPAVGPGGSLRVLVADDHGLFREGLKHLLGGLGAEVEIIEATSGRQAMDLVRSLKFDLVLLDVVLPAGSGLACLQLLTAVSPETPAVLLSASDDPSDVERGFQLGAQAYIHKSVSSQTLVGVLGQVLAGEVDGLCVGLEQAPELASESTLTPRQLQVLALLAEGRANKDIADALCITLNTVRAHLASIYRCFGVSTRTAAVVRAIERGMVGARR